MDLDSLTRFLEQSAKDGRLSRGERATFKEQLDRDCPDPRERALLRSRLFEIARAELVDPTAQQSLTWLESVIHLLADSAVTAPTARVAEVLFSPGEACLERLRALFGDTRRSADVCVFTITDDRVSASILGAHRRGVKIRLLSDNDKANDLGSDIDQLRNAGIPVAVDTSPFHMHHKFAIFDDRLLLNGSFNWTRAAAASNEENILLTDDDRLIEPFRQEFARLWGQYAPKRN